jgi:hypothetical protein
MKIGLSLFLICVFNSLSWGLKLELLDQITLGHNLKFESSTIGGLSGIYFDSESSTLYAVSDDRGRHGEPRLYEFGFKFTEGKLRVIPQAVHFMHKGVQHEDPKSKPKIKPKSLGKVLDMEGLAPLPWGNFLISSEGDNNHKPRIPPEILDVKKNGAWVRSFEIPKKFIPEASGKQTRGIRNNRGFEAVTGAPSGNQIFLIHEEALVQDSDEDAGPVRIVVFGMPEAWVLKPSKELLYQPELGGAKAGEIQLGGRVTEALALSQDQLLVLERSVQLGTKAMGFTCRLFLANLAGASDISAIESLKKIELQTVKPVKKELVLDFETLKEKLGGSIENFEGLAFGPEVNKKKTLIVISDNNFKKSERTQILLFKIED